MGFIGIVKSAAEWDLAFAVEVRPKRSVVGYFGSSTISSNLVRRLLEQLTSVLWSGPNGKDLDK